MAFPYSLGTWASPGLAYLWYTGVFGQYGAAILAPMYMGILFHMRYLYNLRNNVDKVWYVRGGMWKFEISGFVSVKTQFFFPMKDVKLLTSSGRIEMKRG